ncbi:hypothetical protein PNEG_03447 [Pneumocystis murina B123]|uniref:Uncharacterized protein n=1 Tax=Pneumocystis murina (strain B123) TaxID=1069680 RepID=M7NIA8_PNEMU|nr:hypothetical protein PNEG_03447 [Pneumocystis murina B123]EMR08283.1 hypothetical protein PNEG_03447 [Pneumocystis murina B123]
MVCLSIEEKDIFYIHEPIPTRSGYEALEVTLHTSDTTNQQAFLDLSEETEQIIRSAMKHLDIFGERIEMAKLLLPKCDFIQTISSDQTMNITTNNLKFTSQLVKDILKLRDDIREMKRHFIFLKKPHSILYLKQKSKILKKKNNITISLNGAKKNLEKEKSSKEGFKIFEKQLMARFPRLYSELSISQIETSNLINLEKTDSDFSNSALATAGHCKINDALFFDNKILDTGISYEFIQ